MEDLSTFLLNKRTELKLSLRDAAKSIGISHSYLSTLEKGLDPRNNAPVKPTPETLQLISDAYKISYEYLMKLSGYIDTELKEDNKLTKKDEKDISEILKQAKEQLENSEGLMFDGEPASPEAIQSILQAMEMGMALAKQKNKEKYTPKKYKKDNK